MRLVVLASAGGCAVCCWRVVHPGACCCNRAPSLECWRGSLVVWRRLGGEPGERACGWANLAGSHFGVPVGRSLAPPTAGRLGDTAAPLHFRSAVWWSHRHSGSLEWSLPGPSPGPAYPSVSTCCITSSPSFFAAVLTFGEWPPLRVWPPVLSVSPPACPAGDGGSCKLQAASWTHRSPPSSPLSCNKATQPGCS